MIVEDIMQLIKWAAARRTNRVVRMVDKVGDKMSDIQSDAVQLHQSNEELYRLSNDRLFKFMTTLREKDVH